MAIPAAAEPHEGVEYLDLEQTPLAVIRTAGVSLDSMPSAVDSAFGALGAAIGDGAFTPAGPALAVYHGDPMATFDLELGFPVTATLDGPIRVGGKEIEPGSLDARPVAATTHVGGYDGLGGAWERVVTGAAADGHQPTGVWIEVYVTDPSSSTAENLRTDLYMPIDS